MPKNQTDRTQAGILFTESRLSFCWVQMIACTLCLAVPGAIRPVSGPLRVHPENSRYFTDDSGEAVYLTGSHAWGNLCDYRERWPAFDFTGYLDFLEHYNHNFIRL